MTRGYSPPPATVSEALSLLNTDVLQPMMALLPKATPQPTRKADMVAEIAARLTTDKRTASLCLRAGERLLAVPATSEEAFRKAARAMGYGMPPR